MKEKKKKGQDACQVISVSFIMLPLLDWVQLSDE